MTPNSAPPNTVAPATPGPVLTSAGAIGTDLLERARAIRLVAMDVDGTLTDGTIWIGAEGETAKAFSVRDGYGLALLARHGFTLAIVTGRRSAIVERRAAELGITHIHQAVKDKRRCLQQLCDALGISPAEAAFVGDDWPDLPALELCGLPVAPADAEPEVRAAAAYVTPRAGGHGALRDLAMLLLEARGLRAEALDGARLGR